MKPFDKKKAAEFYVVAWVKNWSIRTYLTAIGCRELDFDDIHDLYSFMPKVRHEYIHNTRIRPLTARYMRLINDKLYDAKDNKQLLKVAVDIERFTSDREVIRKTHKEELENKKRAKKELRIATLSHKVSVELMRRGSGYHWNVVK